MAAAAAGDEELESLLRNFHRFSQDCKDALMETQAFRVNYSSESKKHEALELHITDLKKDNERLGRLYTETLFKFTNQMKSVNGYLSLSFVFHADHFAYEPKLIDGLQFFLYLNNFGFQCTMFHDEVSHRVQRLKEELEKAKSRLLSMEEEHKREIKQLKHDNEMNSNALDCWGEQATDKATIQKLKPDVGAHKTHIDMLSSRLEQVTGDVHQYKNELQDLNVVIMVEQEEKKDMQRKLENTEKELRILKMK